MSTPKFTPGPWVAIAPTRRCIHKGSDITDYSVMTEKTRGQLRDEGLLHYESDPGYVNNITVANQFMKDMSLEEGTANAYLIAAAPEMYELLVELHHELVMDDMSGYGESQREAIGKIIGLIRRARGES